MARSFVYRFDLRFSKLVDLEQRLEQRFEFVQRELGCRVAHRRRRVVVDFHEQSVNAAGHAGARQVPDVFRLPAGGVAKPAGQLQAVRGVEDDRVSELAHYREGAHVHDQVVIAETRPALGDHDLAVTRGLDLFNYVADVERREELALLDVDRAPGRRRGPQQIGLATEERGDLQDVRDLGRLVGLMSFVNVGDDGRADFVLDLSQYAQPFFHSQAAKRAGGRAVCFVVRGFEDERDVEPRRDARNLAGHHHRVIFRFDHAWAGDQEEVAFAAFDVLIKTVHLSVDGSGFEQAIDLFDFCQGLCGQPAPQNFPGLYLGEGGETDAPVISLIHIVRVLGVETAFAASLADHPEVGRPIFGGQSPLRGQFGQRFDVFRADAADDDLEGSVFAGGEQLQLVEDRNIFPLQFPEPIRRAVVEQQVAEAVLRLRQRDAIYDCPRRIDPPAPDHFGLLVLPICMDSDRGDADLHLDRAFAFGDFDSEPFPCAARLGPISERRRRDAQIPPGVPLRRVERDRLLIAAQRFLPVALLLAQQAEVVPGRRPRGPELDRLLIILDRLGDQAALLELDGFLVVAVRKRL